MSQREDQNAGAEPDALGGRGGERQGREGVEKKGRRVRRPDRNSDVIGDPDVREAEVLGLASAARHPVERCWAELREADPEIHHNISRPHAGVRFSRSSYYTLSPLTYAQVRALASRDYQRVRD
jgi:hypothetical protein